MVHPSISDVQAFKLIKKGSSKSILEGPTYILILAGNLSKKMTWLSYVLLDIHQKYVIDVLLKSQNGFACLANKYLRKNKMPKQTQANTLQLCPRIEVLNGLCPI